MRLENGHPDGFEGARLALDAGIRGAPVVVRRSIGVFFVGARCKELGDVVFVFVPAAFIEPRIRQDPLCTMKRSAKGSVTRG